MKILDFLANKAGFIKAATFRDSEGWFYDWLTAGGKTSSGLSITNDTSLSISTVFACMRNISEDIAKLPLILYQDTAGGGKEKRKDDSLYKILHDSPNSEMNSMTFRQTLTAHCLGWGNGYAEIERNSIGEIIGLWPLRPDRVSPKRNENNQIEYEVTTDDYHKVIIPARNILHIPGFGYDGLVGYNVIRYARESLGLVSAAERFGASFFGNGATMGGALEHPGKLSKEASDRLIASVNEKHQGAEKAHQLMVLEEGMKFTTMSIAPEESQFLETRQFSVAEICRWFRMPPNKVADTTRAQGWSTLEQSNIDYVTDTLMPWAVRWEQAIQLKLITPDDSKEGYFASHLFAGLLRGDTNTRFNAYTLARNGGWMSVNEIREKEDLNPIGGGDEYTPTVKAAEPAPKETKPAEDTGDDQKDEPKDEPMQKAAQEVIVKIETPAKVEKPKAESYRILVEDVSNRIVNAEIRELEKHLKKQESPEKRTEWLDKFYSQHAEYVSGALTSFAGLYTAQTQKTINLSSVYELCISKSKAAVTKDSAIVETWKTSKSAELTNLIFGVLNDQ